MRCCLTIFADRRAKCYLLRVGNRKESSISLLPALLQLSSHSDHPNIPHNTGYQPYFTLRILNLTSSWTRIHMEILFQEMYTLSFLRRQHKERMSPHMLHVGATNNKPVVATGNSDSAKSITLPDQSVCLWLQPHLTIKIHPAVELFRFEMHQVLKLRTVITQDRMFVVYLTTLHLI